jgi:hypothetical protein
MVVDCLFFCPLAENEKSSATTDNVVSGSCRLVLRATFREVLCVFMQFLFEVRLACQALNKSRRAAK